MYKVLIDRGETYLFFDRGTDEIDYKKDGFSSKIVFNNPNVTHSCGCGESFSLK